MATIEHSDSSAMNRLAEPKYHYGRRHIVSGDIRVIKWFNHLQDETDVYLNMDIAILELDFANHLSKTGLLSVKKNMSLDEFKQLFDEDVFDYLAENWPRGKELSGKDAYEDGSAPTLEIGRITCLIDNKKYTIRFDYRTKKFLYAEDSTVLNPENLD